MNWSSFAWGVLAGVVIGGASIVVVFGLLYASRWGSNEASGEDR